MLGTRTKKIYSYGKRTQRVVSVSENQPSSSIFDDEQPVSRAPIASKMKKRQHPVHPKPRTPSPKVVRIHRKKKSGSPALPPSAKFARLAQILDAETPVRKAPSRSVFLKKADVETPSRTPLAPFSINTLKSPSVARKPARSKVLGMRRTSSKLNKPFSPFVDVDIIVLDDDGATIKQERRVSRTDIQPNPSSHPVFEQSKPTRIQKEPAFDLTDSEEENVKPLKQRKRRGIRSALTIYSDDSDLEELTPLSPAGPGTTADSTAHRTPPIGVEHPAPSVFVKQNKLSTPKPRLPSLAPDRRLPSSHSASAQYIPSPIPRPRQLTPIRLRTSGNRFNPPSLPSPSLSSTDLDLSLEIEALDIVASSQLNQTPNHCAVYPEYLTPLLAECGQSACGPIEFSSFIETFPFDPIVSLGNRQPSDLQFSKVGEASYSEVFGIGDVVLKVIPLRDETGSNVHPWDQDDLKEEGPSQSDARDVLKEIIVTHAMGQVCSGFVKLLKAYVVRGKYPELLLRLWDLYATTKGSESVRPDRCLVSQVYAIIVLPNGGPDLDTYKFVNASKMGWRQACSIFWQVAKSLARAEQLVSFEHRDLHLSQILIKDLPMVSTIPLQARNQNSKPKARALRVFMDDLTHGVRTTLIDLGLSRMDAGDGSGGEMVHWTTLEDEVFTGEGDYQFDIYRMMRKHNGNEWEEFNPLTNVMWLHYLAVKLLQYKRLKLPSSRSSPAHDTAAFTEKDCYDCLVEIESWLRDCLAALIPATKSSKPKGRKRTQPPPSKPAPSVGPVCAGEIVAYAAKKGWIQPI